MIINNKISRTLYGPFLFFGYTFVVISCYAFYLQQWFQATIMGIIAWFLLGSYSGIEINTATQQFREYNMWFGIFKTGKWQQVNQYIGLTLIPMHKVYRIYSRSNRSSSSAKTEYQIYFISRNKRPAIPVMKCKNREEAQNRMDELALWLHLPVFSPKH